MPAKATRSSRPVAEKDWQRELEESIPLPRGRKLVTMKDAADYMMKLRKADRELQIWKDAGEAVIMAAEGRGPVMQARIGMLRALNRNVERTFTDRKDTHWGKRKLKRDE